MKLEQLYHLTKRLVLKGTEQRSLVDENLKTAAGNFTVEFEKTNQKFFLFRWWNRFYANSRLNQLSKELKNSPLMQAEFAALAILTVPSAPVTAKRIEPSSSVRRSSQVKSQSLDNAPLASRAIKNEQGDDYQKLAAKLQSQRNLKNAAITISNKYAISGENFQAQKPVIIERFNKPIYQQNAEVILGEIDKLLVEKQNLKFNTFYNLFDFCLERKRLHDQRKQFPQRADACEKFYQPAKVAGKEIIGEIYQHDVHPNALKKVQNLKNDEVLEQSRQALGIPAKGKSLHIASRIRDEQYGYGYTQPNDAKEISYAQWRAAAINKKTKQMISGEGLTLAAGWYMYVVTLDNQFRYLPCENTPANALSYTQYRCHSQLGEGRNVYGAGTFHIGANGRIDVVTNASGHYRPEKPYLEYSVKVLERMGVDTKNIRMDAEVIQRNEASLAKKLSHFASVGAKAIEARFSKKPSSLIEGRPDLPPHLEGRMKY